MMEPIEFGHWFNSPVVVNGPTQRRLFVQSEMGPVVVVVIGVVTKQPAQMGLAHYNHMIQQDPPARSPHRSMTRST